jgi:hypothetical protein
MQPDLNLAPPSLIACTLDSSSLNVATTTLKVVSKDRLVATRTRHWKLARRDGQYSTQGEQALKYLAAMWTILPERAAPQAQRAQSAEAAPNSKPLDDTHIIYATRSGLNIGNGDKGRGAPRTSRWSVRGHWRNQWLPSTEEHRRIWIDEHTAGALELEVTKHDRVYVVVPRTSGHS